jgi:hypothetical protein
LTWRALCLTLWVGCTAGPRQHAVDAAQVNDEDPAAALLVAIDQLSADDRLALYGCEPETWPTDWQEPEQLLSALQIQGRAIGAATTSAQVQEATQWCDFRSPLGCCRSEHSYTWDWVPRGGEASGAAWTAQGGYAMACRFAPKGYKSARGCLNYVAIAPLAAMDVDALNPTLTRPDPPTYAVRLQILRDTLEALRLGTIDE